MITSQNTRSTFRNEDDLRPSKAEIAYSRAIFRRQVHDQILAAFMDFAKDDHFARSKLADRLGLNRSQITRWLSAPGNRRIDTISDLLLAMSYKPTLVAKKLDEQQLAANFFHKNSTAGSSDLRTKRLHQSSSSREPTVINVSSQN